MNILITSIGQRGYLIDHFKEYGNGKNGVYAADASVYAPALQNADKAFIIPLASSSEYYDALLKICLENNISGIVSINDLELPVLAKYKNDFKKHGIIAVISDSKTIEMCFDKYKTYEFCVKNGINVPRTYLWNQRDALLSDLDQGFIKFPLIAKPRKGSRSVGIHLIDNKDRLLNEIDQLQSSDISEDQKVMFQEYIDSDQYSVHIFNNAEGVPVEVVSMVNIFKRFGETFHIKTIRNKKLIDLGVKIGESVRHCGPLSADVHMRENGDFVVLEFNPRISGCYSLSHYAGADFTGKIYNLIDNLPITADIIDGFDDDVIMLKQFTTAKLSQEVINSKVINLVKPQY